MSLILKKISNKEDNEIGALFVEYKTGSVWINCEIQDFNQIISSLIPVIGFAPQEPLISICDRTEMIDDIF